MIKELGLISILSVSSLQAGFLDSVMSVVSSPEAQNMAKSAISNTDLIKSVTKSTDLNALQSSSAVSNILNYSKSNMSSGDYSKISNSIPGFSQLTSNGITSAITSSKMLNDSFKSIGIDPSLIQTIVPLVINYVKSSGGNQAGDIISNSLSSLLK